MKLRRPQPGDKWHLDEVFIKVCGETHYLWRAVDQDGNVLDILVQSQRNAKAATRFFKKLLKGLRYAPRVMITDKLASYGAARKQMRLSIEHRQHKGLNNRAENSHQPTRQKERQMKKFKSPGTAQRFLSAHGPINNLFRPRRHLLKATAYRAARKQAFSTSAAIALSRKAVPATPRWMPAKKIAPRTRNSIYVLRSVLPDLPRMPGNVGRIMRL